MDIPTLVQKYSFYQQQKQELEATKVEKMAYIEEEVESNRAKMLAQVDKECQELKAQLEGQFETNYLKAVEKLDNYIELLKELIEDARLEEAQPVIDETKIGEDINEHNRDDNSVL